MQPVVFLHGGPGGGTAPGNRRFFDPDFYRIILFDQVFFFLDLYFVSSALSISEVFFFKKCLISCSEVQGKVPHMLAWRIIPRGTSLMTLRS